MPILQTLRRYPLVLLGVALAGFGAWVAADLSQPRTPPEELNLRPLPPENSAVAFVPPEPVGVGPQVVTPHLVSQLQPGMLRSDVEAVIGPPPAELVQPVTEVGGKFVYRTTYPANLDPATPRLADAPASRRVLPPPAPAVKTLIALEFDATRPGHPLVKIHTTGVNAG